MISPYRYFENQNGIQKASKDLKKQFSVIESAKPLTFWKNEKNGSRNENPRVHGSDLIEQYLSSPQEFK